jgi:hypothetical protein
MPGVARGKVRFGVRFMDAGLSRMPSRGAWLLAATGCAALLAGTICPAQNSSTPATAPTAATQPSTAAASAQPPAQQAVHSSPSKRRKSRKLASRRPRGQKQIDPKRAQQIQQALVREHYLDGKTSGVWDDATQKAMQRYQADNGWQSKTTPDARALIKLGLGPDHNHLLNPESAMTTQPQPRSVSTAPATPPVAPDKSQR